MESKNLLTKGIDIREAATICKFGESIFANDSVNLGLSLFLDLRILGHGKEKCFEHCVSLWYRLGDMQRGLKGSILL